MRSNAMPLAPGRDPGLMLALGKAGGVRSLARKLSVHPSSVCSWSRVPRDRVFDVARVTGLDAEAIRPELAAWIEAERKRKWFERARERFAVAGGLTGTATVRGSSSPKGGSPSGGRAPDRPDPRTLDLLDLGLITAGLRFAAEDRGLTVRAVVGAPTGGAGGAPTPEQSARSLGMALAVVVGRVNAETVAAVVGVSRQAVDNAAARYLRARDGDDPDDIDADGKVVERGRSRTAKPANESVWDAERRFVARLGGDDA
jgi:DNA-binding transcriptional regulator YdaS (Cro superfamily)